MDKSCIHFLKPLWWKSLRQMSRKTGVLKWMQLETFSNFPCIHSPYTRFHETIPAHTKMEKYVLQKRVIFPYAYQTAHSLFSSKDIVIKYYYSSSSGDVMIRLIDETGANLGMVSFLEAERIAKERGLTCRLVAKASEKSGSAVFKLVSTELLNDKNILSGSRDTTPMGNDKLKEMKFRSCIGEQDLVWKCKKIERFLGQKLSVRVIVTKRAKSNISPQETLSKVIAKVGPVAVQYGNIKTTPNGLIAKLQPSKQS